MDGIVLERPLGRFDHANVQRIPVGLFFVHGGAWGVLPADYDRSQQIVTTAPLLCIEIVSPETKRVFGAADHILAEAFGKLKCGAIEIDPGSVFAMI